MQLDEFLCKRQPETGPFALFGSIGADLAKLFKNRLLILRGDADARVAHRNLHGAIGERRADGDGSPLPA